MTAARKRLAVVIAGLLLGLLAVTLQGVQGEGLEKIPSEDQCRPYIEKALKDLGAEGSAEDQTDSNEHGQESTATGSREGAGGDLQDADDGERADQDDSGTDAIHLGYDKSSSKEESKISAEEPTSEMEVESTTVEITSIEADRQDVNSFEEAAVDEHPAGEDSKENEQTENVEGDDDLAGQQQQQHDSAEVNSDEQTSSTINNEQQQQQHDSAEANSDEQTVSTISNEQHQQSSEKKEDDGDDSGDTDETAKSDDEEEAVAAAANSAEEAMKGQGDSAELKNAANENVNDEEAADKSDESKRDVDSNEKDGNQEAVAAESVEEETLVATSVDSILEGAVAAADSSNSKEESESNANENANRDQDPSNSSSNEEKDNEREVKEEEEEEKEEDDRPEEEELIMEIEIPEVLRPRDHIGQLLKLDEENESKEKAVEKVTDVVLKDLKRLYDNAIKPLETLYKYRDLSNRHFGDPEIFSKPLVLFMGPWSGGKSSIINYLLDIEYEPTSLRTGAEPSPAYFNILMHGEEEEVLDGTQLAADWTFSGLQKFGQGLLDRLRGYKLNRKLLEKMNIVEIPGILEIRKQVQRLFPFNDACQWFIDRADIIFLVYDPAKLDVGPETEAILDQLKGREYQTRIILNKADQVKPEELMRVQGALIWNISPLMSSAEPPIMYSTSLWSRPYEAGAPTRLLYAQERAFLRDLRSAVDKRVEHKIASARRFAVRVRNHAKMVDCYLTTYYNHKSFFAKKKDVADRIIENPQDYHIYEGLSTLTNISRYDLPDPDVYRDFFRLNNLYEFPLLSSTCTYFRGCPINRLDVAIAYDLPELVGKYKKSAEAAMLNAEAKGEEKAATTALPATLSTVSTTGAAQTPTQKAKSGASVMSLS